MITESPYNWIAKKNFPEADFWMSDKGSAESVGTISKEYQPHLIGIKAPAVLLPEYAYYMCVHLHQSKKWATYAQGSIAWKHLRLSDIRKVFNQMSRDFKIQKEAQFKNFVPRRPTDREFLFDDVGDTLEPLPDAA